MAIISTTMSEKPLLFLREKPALSYLEVTGIDFHSFLMGFLFSFRPAAFSGKRR
jgi:hypothetical protein